jgi:hypothetical protein
VSVTVPRYSSVATAPLTGRVPRGSRRGPHPRANSEAEERQAFLQAGDLHGRALGAIHYLAISHVARDAVVPVAETTRHTLGSRVVLEDLRQGALRTEPLERELQQRRAGFRSEPLAVVVKAQPGLRFDLAQHGELVRAKGNHADRLLVVEEAEFERPGIRRPLLTTAPMLLHHIHSGLLRCSLGPRRQVRTLPRVVHAGSCHTGEGRELIVVRITQDEAGCCEPQVEQGPRVCEHTESSHDLFVNRTCNTASMTDTARQSGADSLPTALESTNRHNPYLIVLLAAFGLTWLLAFMLWLALAQVTDYTTYNLNDAAALTTWIDYLVVSGVVAAVGATVIAGISRELRSTRRN